MHSENDFDINFFLSKSNDGQNFILYFLHNNLFHFQYAKFSIKKLCVSDFGSHARSTSVQSVDTGNDINTSCDSAFIGSHARSTSSSSNERCNELSAQVAVEIQHLRNDLSQLKRIRETVSDLMKEGIAAEVCKKI